MPGTERHARAVTTARLAASAGSLLAARSAYDLFAEDYDQWGWQEFWHRNEWPVVEALAGSVGPNARVLDVGAGTGVYAEHFLGRVGLVCAVDVSLAMLRRARARGWARARC